LGIYCISFFLVCFAWRSYVVWRATGKFPVVIGSGDTVYDIVGKGLKVLVAIWAIAVFIFVAAPDYYGYLGPIYYIESQPLRISGLTILLFSLPWIAIAQAQMGKSFRIGVDITDRPDLVTGGMFKFSRNPIYVGIMAGCLGLFLCIPNSLTAVVLVGGVFAVHVQVRLEEEYLRKLHGEVFEKYCRQVRRWL
jgi:protein-S-isoprenylcysteine O-methyltransferase Ste14